MDLKATLPPWALIEMCYRLPPVSLPLLREGQDPSEVANRYGRKDREPGYVRRALEQRKRLKFEALAPQPARWQK
jgi:hypothetical protein